MTVNGIVQNGMIVLQDGCNIPDGTHVQVIVPDSKERPMFLDMLEFAGCLPDLPTDFAARYDHYIHGTPSRE